MTSAANPLLTSSDLPYELPDFRSIKPEHYRPAFDQGMAEHLAEIDEIAGNTDPPGVENTILALERAGRLLARVEAVFSNISSSDTNDEIDEIDTEVSPKLTAHQDSVLLNAALWERVKTLYGRRDELDIDAETRRLIGRYHSDFVRAGADLDPDEKQRLREINEELASLSTAFKQRLLSDTNDAALLVDNRSDLAGLSEDAIAAAAEAATSHGFDGKYLISLVLPTSQPSLTTLTDRAVRERLLNASLTRGARGNDNDTSIIATTMVRLRAERARLLGYPDHATYVLADRTAETTDRLDAMLSQLVPPAIANARAEAESLRAAIDADGAGHELAPWDWAYYSERARKAEFDIDAADLRPYFELNRVLHDGVFYAANRLYGLTFAERDDLAGYHPDVRVFEVFDEDGSPLGLFLGDYFARPSKRGGAWMNTFVDQSHLFGTRPVVVNNLNIPKPPEGQPALLTFDEVNTAFHEFGHALHGLFSDVTYPRFSMNVSVDFVEYPSQVNEMWATWPEVLANYAKHHETGEPLPQELLDRLLASRQWGEGFRTTEYLGAALLDQAWHRLEPDAELDEIPAFEERALTAAGIHYPLVPPRYRTTYFAHIFMGGYSAGYYSYIWSEVLDADSVEWFKENGGLLRENGDWFREKLLSRGGSVAEMDTFREFRGRDPKIEPLLQRRGLE